MAHLAHLEKPLSYIIFKGVVYDTSADGLAFIQPPPPPYILIAQSLHFDWSKYWLWLVKIYILISQSKSLVNQSNIFPASILFIHTIHTTLLLGFELSFQGLLTGCPLEPIL